MPVFAYLGIDTDGDGVADPNDADDDNDGLEDGVDNCPFAWPNDDGFGCPDALPNSIIVDGKEWAQPITFASVLWEEVSDVCPVVHGLSLCNGNLNGVDLRGWRWATTAEVKALIHSYSGTGGGCNKIVTDFEFATESIHGDTAVVGWVSESSTYKYLIAGATSLLPCFNDSVNPALEPAITGGWFYRIRE